jgi:hypothetical protein
MLQNVWKVQTIATEQVTFFSYEILSYKSRNAVLEANRYSVIKNINDTGNSYLKMR